jgi:hypothetical protein
MMNEFSFALIALQRGTTEMRSALPDAPVVAERSGSRRRPRTYRSRAAIATMIARLADLVAPIGWTAQHRAASSR